MKMMLLKNRLFLYILVKVFTKYKSNREALVQRITSEGAWDAGLANDSVTINRMEKFLQDKLKATQRAK